MPFTQEQLSALFGTDPAAENLQQKTVVPQIPQGGPSPFGNISQYEEGFELPYSAEQDPYEIRALNQSGWDKWGNGLAKMGITAGSSGVENTIGLLNGIGAMVSNAIDNNPDTQVTEGLWNNATGKAVDSINLWAKDAFPTYYTEAQQKMGVESALPFSGNATNWWSDKFLGGAGYMLGAIASGYSASGLFRGLALSSEKALLTQGLAAAEKAAMGTTSASLLEKGGLGIVMAHGESSVEARQIKQETFDRLVTQGMDEESANSIATSAGNLGYATNMALIGGTDILMFGKALTSFRVAKQNANRFLASEAGKAVVKAPTTLDRMLPAIKGTFLEGGQEIGQLGISKGSQEFYLRQHDKDTNNDYNTMLEAIGSETIKALGTNEGWESFLLGALLGGPAGAITNRGEVNKEYDRAKIAAEVINTQFKNLANTKANIMQMAVSGKMADLALKEGDKDRFHDEKFNEMKATVKTVEQNGGIDVLISQLESMKNAPADKVREFFQIPAEYNFNETVKNTKINEAINEIKQIVETHRRIKENYPTLSKPVFDALFDATTGLNNVSDRVTSLSNDLSVFNLNFSELDYKTNPEYKKEFDKQLEKTIENLQLINPEIAANITEKAKALKYLTVERREKYIKQLDEALTNPEKIEKKIKEAIEKSKEATPEEVFEAFVNKEPLDEETEFEEANVLHKEFNQLTTSLEGLTHSEKAVSATNKLSGLKALETKLKKLIKTAGPEAPITAVLETTLAKLQTIKSELEAAKIGHTKVAEQAKKNEKPLFEYSTTGNRMWDILQYVNADGGKWIVPFEHLLKISEMAWNGLNNKIKFVVTELPLQEGQDKFVKLEDERFAQRRGIEVNGKLYSVELTVEDGGQSLEYGYLLDPERFHMYNENGVPVKLDMSKTEHIALLRPEFVKNGKLTIEGAEFKRSYEQVNKAFDYIRTQIADGKAPSVKKFTEFVNINKKTFLEDPVIAQSAVEFLKGTETKYKGTKLRVEGVDVEIGPIVYNRNAKLDEASFYEFDYATGTFKPLEGKTGSSGYINADRIGNALLERYEEDSTKAKLNALTNDFVALMIEENNQDVVVALKYKTVDEASGFVEALAESIITAPKVFEEAASNKWIDVTRETGVFLASTMNNKNGGPITFSLEISSNTEDKAPSLKLKAWKSRTGQKITFKLDKYNFKDGKKSPFPYLSVNAEGKLVYYDPSKKTTIPVVMDTTTNSQIRLVDAINIIMANQIGSAIFKIKAAHEAAEEKGIVITDNLYKGYKYDKDKAGLIVLDDKGEETTVEITRIAQRPQMSVENLNDVQVAKHVLTTFHIEPKINKSKKEQEKEEFDEPVAKKVGGEEEFDENAPVQTLAEVLANKKKKAKEPKIVEKPKEEEKPVKEEKKEEPKVEPQKDIAEELGEDGVPFMLSTEEGEERELSEAERNIASILPIKTKDNPGGTVSIKEVETIVQNLSNKNYGWGRLRGNIIELARKRGKGVEFHEAFHAIFRIFLNKEQIAAAYKAAIKKYGTPDEAVTLKDFREQHPSRLTLTKEELTLLWLEEQMADDYMKSEMSWRSMGIFEKIFNKIKRLVEAFFGKYDELEKLFQNINDGNYREAVPTTDVIYFPGEAYKLLNGITNPALNESIIGRMLGRILAVKVNTGTFTKADVAKVANELADTYYTEENFKKPLERAASSTDNKKAAATKIKERFKDIRAALKDETNVSLLHQLLAERIQVGELSMQDVDQDVETDSGLQFATKEAQERGGYSSGSKRMKDYLSTVLVPTDEFNLGLTEEELKDPKYQNYANPYLLHNALDRSMVDSRRGDMLKKLELLSRSNPQLRAFLNRLTRDINAELDTQYTAQELVNLTGEVLDRSVYYNMFISNYNKLRGDRVKTLVDIQKQDFKTIRSNINDIQDSQVEQWQRNWFALSLNVRTSFVKGVVDGIIKEFKQPSAIVKAEDRQALIISLQEKFKSLGIILDESFIKYSWLNWAKDDVEVRKELLHADSEELNEEAFSLFKEVDAFKGTEFITLKFLEGLKQSVADNAKVKSFYSSVEDKEEDEFKDVEVGLRSRLKKIALGNSVFDESIQPVTIKNLEGKTIYLNLFPSYLFYEALLWRTGNRATAFKENKLREEFAADGVQMTDWQYALYEQAIKHNHLLTSENSELFMKNFKIFINEGISSVHTDEEGNQQFFRTDTKDVPYSKMGPAETYALMLAYFAKEERNNFRTEEEGQEFALFIVQQSEGKNTQIAVKMPVQKLTTDTDLSSLGKKLLVDYLKQEHERIHKEYNGVPLIEDWNTGENRKNKLWNFLSVEKVDKDFYNQLLTNKEFNNEKAEEVVEKLMKDKFATFKEELVKEDLIFPDGRGNKVPEYYKTKSKIDDSVLFDFFVNHYLNSLSFNNLMYGDSSLSYKNFLMQVKRVPGSYAAGPSMGTGNTTLDIVEDEIIYGITTTDGMVWGTAEWFIDTYLTGLGKKSVEVARIAKKIQRGYKLNEWEISVLKNNHALFNSKKLSLYDLFIYGKHSMNPLLRSVTSYVEPDKRQELDDLYDRQDAGENVTEEINNLWNPRPGKTPLHNKLNDMYSKGIQLRMSKSAVKTQVVLDTKMIMSNNYIREQLATDSLSDVIPSGVQKIQLITSEQSDVPTVFNGVNTTFKKLAEAYENLLGKKQKEGYKLLRKLLFKGGLPTEEYLVSLFAKSVDTQAEDTMFKLFFTPSEDGKSFKYNLNNLTTLKKAENIFNSIVNSVTFKQEMPGHKMSLVSDRGYGVIREEGKVVSSQEIDSDLKKYSNKEAYPEDRLRLQKDANKEGVYYAECIISAQAASKYGLKKGQDMEFLGVRIPTDDKHSMVFLRVVDVLPGETGNNIVLPYELIDIVGHDFDIDAEFMEGSSFFIKEGQLRYYGSYKKAKTYEKALKAAYTEYIQGITEYDDRFKIDFKKALENDPRVRIVMEQLNQFKIDKKIIKEDFGQFTNPDTDVDNLVEAIFSVEVPELLVTKDRFKSYVSQLKTLREEIQNSVLASLTKTKGTIPTNSVEDFEKVFGKQLKANLKASQEGRFSDVEPLTMGELNNLLHEIGLYLVKNEGNKKIADSHTTRERAVSLRSKLFGKNAEGESLLEDSGALEDINSPQSIVKAKYFNSTGQENIGIAAYSNILFQYLVRKDARNRNKPNSKVFSFLNKANERVNDLMSLHIQMEVDSGKHNDPGYFNLTPDTLGAVILNNMKGMTFEESVLWNIQPSMLLLSRQLSASNGIFSEPISKKKIVEEAKAKYIEAPKNKKEENGYSGPLKDKAITYNQLLQAKLILENRAIPDELLAEGKLTEQDVKYIQYRSIKSFEEGWNENQLLRNFTTIIALAKGTKPNFSEMVRVDESLKALGIKLSLKDDVVSMEHTREYTEDKEKYPYDFLDVIQNSPLLKALTEDYIRYKKDSGYYFVSQSAFGEKAISKVRELLKDRVKADDVVYSQINKLLISFLENKRLGVVGKSMSSGEYLTSANSKNPSSLIELFNIVRADDRFMNNSFVQQLSAKAITYKEQGPLKGKTLHQIVMSSWNKKDPYYQEMMMNGLEELLKSKRPKVADSKLLFKGKPATIGQIANLFAKKLISILVLKDAMAYKNQSPAQYVHPEHLSPLHKALGDIMNTVNSDKEQFFKDTFKQTEDELLQEFLDYAGTDYTLKNNYTYQHVQNLKNKAEGAWLKSHIDNSIAVFKGENPGQEYDYKELKEEAKVAYKEFIEDVEPEDKIRHLPIHITPNTVTVNLFARTNKENDGNKLITLRNFEAVKATGLFKEVPLKSNPKKSGLMPQPYIYIMHKTIVEFGEGKSYLVVYKLKEEVMSKHKALNPDEYTISQALYEKDFFKGHKEMLSTALSLKEWNALNEEQKAKKVESLEDEEFDEPTSAPKYQKQIDQLLKDVNTAVPKENLEEALTLIKTAVIKTDEDMGELINKLCNL